MTVRPDIAAEPSVRADGCCVVCGKPRPKVAVAHGDPFCSNVCCRAFCEAEPEEPAA